MRLLPLLRILSMRITITMTKGKKMETMHQEKIENRMQDDGTEICQNCGYVFKVELMKKGDDWNDFGYRYCPFCGDMTELYA